MAIAEFVSKIPGFASWKHADKIRFFAWYMHSQVSREAFAPGDIRKLYEELHLDKPTKDISAILGQMEQRRPRDVIRTAAGYSLEHRLREEYEKKYGTRLISLEIDKLLSGLPSLIPDLAEKTFLDEALSCLRAGAFRSTIVMTWNLAYHHLCDFVLKKHLALFNKQWPVRFPKLHANSRISDVKTIEDFSELKESEVIDICRSANIISNDVYKILLEKLGKRNSAAHPSLIKFSQLQAEGYIDDLIHNVLLKLT